MSGAQHNSHYLTVISTKSRVPSGDECSEAEGRSGEISSSPIFCLSIAPLGGAARTITGSVAGPLIDFNSADRVLIDGLNTGGNALTIENTLAGAASTIRFINDARALAVQNCTILGANNSATSGPFVFTGLEMSGLGRPELWPNPARGSVYVRLEGLDGQLCSLRITDLQGKLMFVHENADISAPFEISLHDFAAGMYALEIISGGQRTLARLVVQ